MVIVFIIQIIKYVMRLGAVGTSDIPVAVTMTLIHFLLVIIITLNISYRKSIVVPVLFFN
jgi:hypothetical protein